jgi:glucose-1-phosphate cytidylyltransferase
MKGQSMKVVILAGGLGTRISEESSVRPKPMIEIGGKPILWHIMKIYSFYGINDFVICCGYKGYFIKEYFANYFLHMSDVTFDLNNNQMEVHERYAEPWRVTLIDTGEETMTGGRLLRARSYVETEKEFFFTYGDGVADIDINKLLQFHRDMNTKATITAVFPPGRFGAVDILNNKVTEFKEKPKGDGGMINGGFFVLSPAVFDLLEGDQTIWEQEPIETLAQEGQIAAYRHEGFWQPMDTLRDKNHLEELWYSDKAPWKVWT